MRKIPTLFQRDPANMAKVTDKLTEGCEWVPAGEGVCTRKYDGTCMAWLDLGNHGPRWYARHEVKPGKAMPPVFTAVDHDPVTGKTVGWVPANTSGWWRWVQEALTDAEAPPALGTYELCGPKVNGNPEGFPAHTLIPHARAQSVPDLDGWHSLLAIREYVAALPFEGVVWHHPDGRMAKLKARDL